MTAGRLPVRTTVVLSLLALMLAACGSTVHGTEAPTQEGLAPAQTLAGIPTTLAGQGPLKGGRRSAVPEGGRLSGPVNNASADAGAQTQLSPAGIAAPRTTIQVGFLNQDNSTLNAQYGYSVPQGEQMDRSLVSALNAQGGLAGHKLVGYYDSPSASSSNYAADIAAACQSFTTDRHVSVVVSPDFSTQFGFADCLQKKGVLELSDNATDAQSLRAHPLMFSAAGSAFEHSYIASLDALHASGDVTSKNHLGVVLEGCPEEQRAWTNAVLPRIHILGVQVEVTTLSCTAGVQDAGTAATAMQGAILKWKGLGVDRVMFVTGYESTLLVLFAPEASDQAFYPGYVLTSNAGVSSVAAGGAFPANQKPGLRGAGTLPGFDVDAPPPATASERRCTALAKSAGLQESAAFDREVLYRHCANLFLLEAALEDSPAAPTTAQLGRALEGIGEGLRLPGLVAGRVSLAPSRHDAPVLVREFGWRASCGCIAYLAVAATMAS